jgi:energy-coupling factor transporter ATP-binding protein EcfA2
VPPSNVSARCWPNPWKSRPAVAFCRPPLQGDIRFEQVSYRYGKDGSRALEAIDLHVERGKFLGIIGPSGCCGKSTLAKLLQGLYRPETGRILIDGALIEADLSRLIGEGQALEAQISRLQAESQGASIFFSKALRTQRPDLIRAQRQLFEARQEALLVHRRASEESIRQRRGELEALQARLSKQQASQKILDQELATITEATEQGLYPKIRLLSVQRELTDARGDIRQSAQESEAAKAALAEAQSQHESIQKDWREQVMSELETRRREHDTNAAQLRQQQERLKNTLRSCFKNPSAGTIRR